MSETYPSERRLRSKLDFDRVFHSQAYAADDVLVVRGCRSENGKTRLGLSVSRKVGNAVARNRARRRLREAVRLAFPDHARMDRDYVVIARRAAITRPFDKLQADLEFALRKLK